jgi:uronate dehydrogenase
MKNILLTGANGRIGKVLRQGLRGVYEKLRVSDVTPLGAANPGEDMQYADLTDPQEAERVMEGIDCVVHMAGQSVEADWPAILAKNISAVYNVFEAARRQKVKRVIFASSHHAIGFYRRERIIDNQVPPRPDSRYGVSKAFGEALGRLYADKYGLAVACLRIGVVRVKPEDVRHLSVWVSPRDMLQLVRRCIDAPAYHYAMIYAVSANSRAFWKNPAAELIGYRPEDSADTYAAELLAAAKPENPLAAPFHGGYYCPPEFCGDPSRID